ncbi:hypothetical protein BN131_2643 [Cronobacter malonaticus 681]|nr:hypothetical protein BN131_2643 [Cronobacter malonaticus 681]
MQAIRDHKKGIIFCLAFSLLYILPILLSNAYFIDDMARSLYGYAWQRDGRTFATLIMQMLTFGSLISNISPYSNIIASATLAITGYIACVVFGIEKDSKIKLSALMVLISPYMLENLTYKYDCVPMAISVMSVVAPFMIRQNRWFPLLAGAGFCITMQTYQASIVVYLIMSSSLFGILLIHKGYKDSLSFAIKCLVGIILGLVLTKIVNLFYPPNYSGRDSLVFSSNDVAGALSKNVENAINYFELVYHGPFKIAYTAIILISLISIIYLTYKSSSYIKTSLGFIFIIASLALTPLINILLLSPWWTARTFIGFPFAILSFLLCIEMLNKKTAKVICFFLIFTSMPLMAIYANALKSQNDYEGYIANSAFSGVNIKERNIAVDGVSPKSEELKIAEHKLPIIGAIATPYMKNGWSWGGHFLARHAFINREQYLLFGKREKVINSKCSMEVLKETNHFKLLGNDQNLVIDFKKSPWFFPL